MLEIHDLKYFWKNRHFFEPLSFCSFAHRSFMSHVNKFYVPSFLMGLIHYTSCYTMTQNMKFRFFFFILPKLWSQTFLLAMLSTSQAVCCRMSHFPSSRGLARHLPPALHPSTACGGSFQIENLVHTTANPGLVPSRPRISAGQCVILC